VSVFHRLVRCDIKLKHCGYSVVGAFAPLVICNPGQKHPIAFVYDGSADATGAQKIQFFSVLVLTKALIYINVIHGDYENNVETGGTSGV